MHTSSTPLTTLRRLLAIGATAFTLSALVLTLPAIAQDHDDHGYGHDSDRDHDHDHDKDHGIHFFPGNLVLSRSVYENKASNVTVGAILPPNCASTTGGCSPNLPTGPAGAPYNGTYPLVWNDDAYDGSFGITSKIYLDQLTPLGWLIDTLEVPNSSQPGIRSTSNQLVTSFSSKSELALNLSTDGKILTFMGYVAPIDKLDVSNSNTALAVDPTNPVGENVYRAVATVDRFGDFTFTETNAYSGNNGRAAILNNSQGANFIYTAGNAGNGANPQPNGIILGAGTQFIEPTSAPEFSQNPSTPTPGGSFNITELPANTKTDKIGKDDNFRGLTVFNNVVYLTKGSGSNGINTVYFIDTVGTACPKGVGLPLAGAALPTTPLTYDPTKLQASGLPSNMCILAGFNTVLAKTSTNVFPFGIWFADANTLYVADEGDGAGGTTLYTHAAAQTTAGLQKWIFNSTTQTWGLAYTIQTGLGLGTPYTVDGYPTGNNPGTSLPWAPATDGLRNITGFVDKQTGDAIIWAITSTISGNGDQGADPNRLVAVRDHLSSTTPTTTGGKDTFYTLRTAGFAEVLRGVSLTPNTKDHIDLF